MFADTLFLISTEKVIAMASLDNIILSKYMSICLLYNRYDLIDCIIELIGNQNAIGFKDFLNEIEPFKRNENT